MRNLRNLFGGNPAVILSLVGAGISLAITFGLHLSSDQEGLVMAAVSAVLGLVTAWGTANKVLSAVLGLFKAVVAVGIGFGLPLTPDQTGALIAFATLAIGLFNHAQNSPAVGGPGNDGAGV